MSSPTPSERRDTPRRRRVISLRACVVTLGVAMSAAGLSAYSVLAPETFPFIDSQVPPYVLATATAVAVVVVAWFVLGARRSRARVGATLDWIHDYELTPQTFVDHPELDRRKSGGESLALRTLRAQVRTLEQALEQEQQRPTTLAVRTPENVTPDAFRRDVALTLRALARRTADDENPRHTLARAAAAIERLGAPEAFARPVLAPAATVHVLPSGRIGRLQVQSPRQPVMSDVVAPPAADAPVPAPASGPVVEETVSSPEADLAPTTDEVLPVPDGPEIVRPVPPVDTGHPTQRGRRWFRRHAA